MGLSYAPREGLRTMIFGFQTKKDKALPPLVEGVVVLRGDLALRGPGVLHGRIDGTVSAKDPVVLAEDAAVSGGVKAGDLEVRGRMEGWVRASGSVLLEAGSELTGPLRAGALEIRAGARYRGTVTVVPEGA